MAILLMFIAIDKVQMLLMLCQAGETQAAVKKKKKVPNHLGREEGKRSNILTEKI